MKRTLKYTLSLLSITLVLVNPMLVSAETITLEVSGNGEGSVSSLQTQSQDATTITQSNQGAVNNDINVDANTGDNQASDSTASQTSIDTGDVNTHVEATSHINTNTADLSGCCQQTEIEQVIVGNGTNSINTLDTSLQNQQTLVQSNQATITNTLVVYANTGNNKADDNTASVVTINTGSINHHTSLNNLANSNISIVPQNYHDTLVVTIANNGWGSENTITTQIANVNNAYNHNFAKTNNQIYHYFNTGNNTAKGNTGALVAITTGDINAVVTINNTLNTNLVKFPSCCQITPPDPDDPGSDNPSNPNNGGSGSSDKAMGGSSSSSQSSGDNTHNNGQVLGAILPETGFNSLYLLAFNALLFLGGLGLRTRVWTIFQQDYVLVLSVGIRD